MLEGKLFVTHIFNKPPRQPNWERIPFFTQRTGETQHHLGYSFERSHSPEELALLVNTNTYIELEKKYDIIPTKAVWLTPEKEVYIARLRDPQNDPDVQKIDVLFE